MKRYINVGCGLHYCHDKEWTNLDFVKSGPRVIGHNLLKGIPFSNDAFELVYHSHVLEHFSKQDGEKFIKECFRVLKPGGIIRIAIPNLEEIALNYLFFLKQAWDNPEDKESKLNYQWMMLELYDQTVRSSFGGEMLKYLSQDIIENEEFVFTRIGDEGREIRKGILESEENAKTNHLINLRSIKKLIRKSIRLISRKRNIYEKIGRFRLGGEIHQWMYDRYSLRQLLLEAGFEGFLIQDAFTSYNPNWKAYNLDGKDGVVRKPDSLFIEAIKPG